MGISLSFIKIIKTHESSACYLVDAKTKKKLKFELFSKKNNNNEMKVAT